VRRLQPGRDLLGDAHRADGLERLGRDERGELHALDELEEQVEPIVLQPPRRIAAGDVGVMHLLENGGLVDEALLHRGVVRPAV